MQRNEQTLQILLANMYLYQKFSDLSPHKKHLQNMIQEGCRENNLYFSFPLLQKKMGTLLIPVKYILLYLCFLIYSYEYVKSTVGSTDLFRTIMFVRL